MVLYVKDTTGRFGTRPHFTQDELDAECEQVISEFLRQIHGAVKYPVATDDLTRLIEAHAGDLDLYADLSDLGEDVEGVTDFMPGGKPRVRISRLLSEDLRRENRLRTTLTHEFGHVHFHTYLWDSAGRQPDLFPSDPHASGSLRCKRQTILATNKTDWMEWQAGYACGSILMPATPVKRLVADFFTAHGLFGPLPPHSLHGQDLIRAAAAAFQVSEEAATVRLSRLAFLAENDHGQLLWQ